MLKRITKTTGLLLCMVSVISLVPAKAADIQKIEAEEGTIYSAAAKGKGIYIDGEINDKDEAIYYISEDGKYNEIEGLDDGDALNDLLLKKYMEIDEDTYVDITDNYKVLDENIREDLEDDAATTLRKKIKSDNDGRFDESFYKDIVEATVEGKDKFLSAASGLAIYKYTLEDTRINGETTSTIYSDLQGNYIDADYNLGNLKVRTTDDSVTIKNTEDTYEIKENGTTYEIKAEIKHNKNIADSDDSIYRFADLTIYKREEGGAWKAATNEFTFGSDNYQVTTGGSVTVLQKFSKTQAADDIDGIKYSKDSTIYFIADEDGNSEYILGKSAADAVSKVGAATGGKTKIAVNEQGLCSIYLDTKNSKIYAEKLKLKSKNGFNYVDIGDYDSSSTDVTDKILTAGGTAWVLDSGYIKTWDGNESFTKVYKVDGSMNNMSVSSKDNIIVWNEDDGVYSIIHNVVKTEKTPDSTSTTATTGTDTTTAGWVKVVDGTWTYNKADGTKAAGWLNDGNAWYYLKANGVMATGWIQDGSTWYYLDASGAIKTGWINDNGTWYYCNTSGAMLANTTIDGYVLGANGAWVK